MIIFIDFDDVLFYTKKFKDNLYELFLQNGINRDLYDKYYYDPNDKERVKTYDPWKHIERIRENERIGSKELEADLNRLVENTNPYLFKDSEKFLESFRGEKIFIVSYGTEAFQKMKIGECRIGEYCEHFQIVIVQRLKAQAIREIIHKEKLEDGLMLFIDDRIEQIEDVKKSFPLITTIMVKRAEGRYQDSANQYCDYVVADLNQARDIISNLKQKHGKN